MEEMKLYRFSSIQTDDELLTAINYVATAATKMMFRNTGNLETIKSLTIFAHYADEYKRMLSLMKNLGEQKTANNGLRFVLNKPIHVQAMSLEVNGHPDQVTQIIEEVRIRKPDPYRTQVGCCDIEVDKRGFEFREDSDGHHSSTSRLIKRPDLRMIEYFDPDFDVLIYAVEPA